MALVTSGVSEIGRSRFNSPLVQGSSYILRFPEKTIEDVRYEGVWELLRFNTPLSTFVQILVVPLWVDAHIILGTNITSTNHRMSWVWRRSGVVWELHTA
jgi:hypothetical protein